MPAFDAGPEPAALDLREVLDLLRNRAWLILAVALAITAAAAFYFSRQAPVYRAKASVRFTDERRQLTGGIDAEMGKIMGQGADPILSQIQVLQSRRVAEQIVSSTPVGTRMVSAGFPLGAITQAAVSGNAAADTIRLQFLEDEVLATGYGTAQRTSYGMPLVFPGVQFTIAARPATGGGTLVVRSFDVAARNVQSRLVARPRKGTDVIDVEYTASDPYVAQTVANAAVATFQDFNEQSSQLLSVRRREFIGQRLQQTDSVLREAQNALTRYRTHRGVYGSSQQITQEQQGLMQLDIRRGELDADRRVATRLLDALSTGSGNSSEALRTLVSSPSVASNPVVSQIYSELVQYERLRDSLTTGSGAAAASNPDVQRINSLVGQTEQRLAGAVRSHVQALDARIEALDALRSRSAAGLQQLPQAEADEERLRQTVMSTLALADELRQEFQRARIAEAVEGGQVQILDLATLPTVPIGTSFPVKLALASLVGLFFAIGLVVFLEQLNTSIRSREDIERYLDAPVLAVIPRIKGAAADTGVREMMPKGRALPTIGARIGVVRTPEGDTRSANLLTDVDTSAAGGEAYRTLRTNLIFSRATSGIRTLVVTSAAPGDGKTTTATNLAVAFAHQGLRVLVVDCDLRRSRVHEVFGVAKEPGLTQVLLNFSEVRETVVQTAVDGLFVLSAGTTPPNPSELLGSPAMSALVSQLSQLYDLVIFDSPPVLAAADAAILGRQADGVIVVTLAGRTDRAAAASAVDQLRAVGAHVLGGVLNDPHSRTRMTATYYGYYSDPKTA